MTHLLWNLPELPAPPVPNSRTSLKAAGCFSFFSTAKQKQLRSDFEATQTIPLVMCSVCCTALFNFLSFLLFSFFVAPRQKKNNNQVFCVFPDLVIDVRANKSTVRPSGEAVRPHRWPEGTRACNEAASILGGYGPLFHMGGLVQNRD